MSRKVHGEGAIPGNVAVRQQVRMLMQSFWLRYSLPEGGVFFDTIAFRLNRN